ncbi:ME53 [Parapoynx stagnalis nucleopolyhedrovirus]|uniref:ME53 n=1 Tax=Parapoynx stagnalis nucleopolyhedrovirus TaxID=2993413 RepID=A0A9E8BW84_9ABAC|nr:ME53 [Parapoynx stagnalis nucleopolyhedrovirus]
MFNIFNDPKSASKSAPRSPAKSPPKSMFNIFNDPKSASKSAPKSPAKSPPKSDPKNVRTKSLPSTGGTITSPVVNTRSSSLRKAALGKKTKNFIRGDNADNEGVLVWTSPEFGDKFKDDEPKLKRLDTTDPHDIRSYFLSEIERQVMLATLKFSTNYVCGFIDTKDMRLMGAEADQFKYKTRECYVESYCTVCKYRFNDNIRRWQLSVWVHHKKELNDPKRFDFCCTDCAVEVEDILNIHEIYPRINLNDLHHLNDAGFFTCYIFPQDVGYYNVEQQKSIEFINHHGNPYKIIQQVLMKYKQENEHILSITLTTMGRTVFVEQYKRIDLQRYRCSVEEPASIDEVDCFLVNDDSEMMKSIQEKRFRQVLGTVFAVVKFRTHKSNFAGVITFPLNILRFCELCKKPKLYNKNPILYCTKCGFTTRYRFANKEFKNFLELPFDNDFVKSREFNNEMILYYDVNEFNKNNEVK